MRTLALFVVVALLSLPIAAPAQLKGCYTINPALPLGATNYVSLSAAVADLLVGGINGPGVAGPVIFDIFDDAGVYAMPMPFATNNVTWAPSTAVLTLGQWAGASAANRVTFRAGPGESPVFDASNQAMGVFWNGAEYVTVEGIEIFGAVFDGVTLYSETMHGQALDPIIRRCNIHDCGAGGVIIYGNSQRPQNTLVENNFFWNLQTTNAGGFSTLARFGYVSGRRHDFSRVIHNTFYVSSSAGSAFAVIGDTPSGGTGSHYIEVSNNIIVKTSNPAAPIYNFPLSGVAGGIPALVDSNCYWDTSGGPFSAGAVVAADLPTWQAGCGCDAGSFSADPLLVNPVAGDLHLGLGSPCVGASTVAGGPPDDIDDTARDLNPDIGADEQAGALTPWQRNQACSCLDADGLFSNGYAAAVATVPVGTATTISFGGNPGLPWDVAVTFGTTLVPLLGMTPTGQVVNINVVDPSFALLFGGSFINAFFPFTAAFTPTVSGELDAQMINLDPASADGFCLSQGVGILTP